MLKQFWEVKHLWGMPPKNSGGSTKFPGGHEVIHRTAQTAFVRVITPRSESFICPTSLDKACIRSFSLRFSCLSLLTSPITSILQNLLHAAIRHAEVRPYTPFPRNLSIVTRLSAFFKKLFCFGSEMECIEVQN